MNIGSIFPEKTKNNIKSDMMKLVGKRQRINFY
ncbi:Protein of unknown function [Lactobacillus equicursoris DSM 19284 = JCM 14600 = CIP 110162]|nr:Protein of unknown function [Lactobacillus equicursoris DSM 19284 = JCM 14600 = CIP 110162]